MGMLRCSKEDPLVDLFTSRAMVPPLLLLTAGDTSSKAVPAAAACCEAAGAGSSTPAGAHAKYAVGTYLILDGATGSDIDTRLPCQQQTAVVRTATIIRALHPVHPQEHRGRMSDTPLDLARTRLRRPVPRVVVAHELSDVRATDRPSGDVSMAAISASDSRTAMQTLA